MGLVLFEFCSFPVSLWSPQRVPLVLVKSFLVVNLGIFAISSGKCSEYRECSNFHCHVLVPAIFTLLRNSESCLWLSPLMFYWLLFPYCCELVSFLPLILCTHNIPVILSSFLQFILYSPMSSIGYKESHSRPQ